MPASGLGFMIDDDSIPSPISFAILSESAAYLSYNDALDT